MRPDLQAAGAQEGVQVFVARQAGRGVVLAQFLIQRQQVFVGLLQEILDEFLGQENSTESGKIG